MINDHNESPLDIDSTIQCWTPWPELKWLQTDLVCTLVYMLNNIRPRVGTVDLNDNHVMSDLAKVPFIDLC